MERYEDKSLTELLEIAKERVLEVPIGDEFKVCDLFLGFLWHISKDISNSNHSALADIKIVFFWLLNYINFDILIFQKSLS